MDGEPTRTPHFAASEKTDRLRQLSLFDGIPLADLCKIASRGDLRCFEPDDTLLGRDPKQRPDIANTVHILLSGSVMVINHMTNGDRVYIARRGPGTIIGELEVLIPGFSPNTSVAETPVVSFVMDRDEFKTLLQSAECTAFTYRVMQCLARKIQETALRIASLLERSVPGRVADDLLTLLNYTRESDDNLMTNAVFVANQQRWATYLKTDPAVLSRLLAEWEKQEIIQRTSKQMLLIKNETQLLRLRDRL